MKENMRENSQAQSNRRCLIQLATPLHTELFLFTCYHLTQKGKQKSPGRASSRSRSHRPTPGGREKVTQVKVCIANKQMHHKHKDQLPLPQAR